MCAINGFNFKDRGLIDRMNAATLHRGPDGTGVYIDEQISLGHNRLSIIDLSHIADQPMFSSDGNLVIVFNGEIYNFQELKQELTTYDFKSSSDTEVLLAGYEAWGVELFKKCNGMFALAIFDKRKNELVLARDRVGIKPLYYYLDNGAFIFSSEIKGILEHNIPRILNKEAFEEYFSLLYVPAPNTLFKDVCVFPAGSYGIVRDSQLKITSFTDKDSVLNVHERKIDAKTLAKEIEGAVTRQLVSDRPLGIYLSGGIDSSVILDVVSRIRTNIETFSVGFDLENKQDQAKFNADFELARKTAAFYKTKHHEVLLSAGDFLRLFEKTVIALDQPIANATSIAQMKIAEFSKQNGVDVVLTGEGGDELFGGYERYRMAFVADWYQKVIPNAVRTYLASKNDFFRKLNLSGVARYTQLMFQKESLLRRIMCSPLTESLQRRVALRCGNVLSRGAEGLLLADETSWLVDEALMRGDKTSMSVGLEARVPYLDNEVVALAHRIPFGSKVSFFGTKRILKDAFRNRLPQFLFKQPKRGWFSPAAKWLRYEEVDAYAQDVLSSTYYSGTANLFNWQEISRIRENHKIGKEYNASIIIALLMFQVWAKQCNVQVQ